jgi:hypothetical protein
MIANYALDADGPSPHTVQLGEGLPTKEELLAYYPAIFTWTQLKTFVNSGYFCMMYVSVAIVESLSPGILGCSNARRNYSNDMNVGLKGSRPSMEAMVIDFLFFPLQFSSSVENYLIRSRLQWGKADTLSKLPSRLSPPVVTAEKDDVGTGKVPLLASGLPPIPPDTKPYFTANIPLQLVSIIVCDWPYSGGFTCVCGYYASVDRSLVPLSVEHYLIWTVLPIIHDIPSIIKARLLQDGLWGFTGYTPDSPPPSPSLLPACLPALSDWCIKEESLIRTPRGTEEEEIAVREAGLEVHKFIIATWREREWETAWFVNPPVSTLPNLSHVAF